MPSIATKLTGFPIPAKIAIAFFTAAIAPALLAIILMHESSTKSTVDSAHAHLVSLSEARNQLLETHINSLRASAATLAETDLVTQYLLALHSGDFVENTHFADDAHHTEKLIHNAQEQLWGQTHHIFLLDASGHVVLSPPHGEYDIPCRMPCDENPELLRQRLGTHLGDNLSDAEWFNQSLQAPYITSFFGFEERDHFHQLILHPIKDNNGEPLGALACEVAIDRVIHLLTSDFELGRSGRIELLTTEGRPVVHLKADQHDVPPSVGLLQAVNSGVDRIGDYTTADGRDVYGIYLPSSVYPWTVAIEIDQEEVHAPVAAQRAQIASVLAGISVLFALAGVAIGMWFGLPLQRCAQAARNVAAGDLKTAIPVTRSDGEIRVLQQSIESMRTRLIEQIHKLDEQVEHRTQQLESANNELIESQERYELAVQGSRDAIWDWDLASDSFYYAPRWAELLGISENTLAAEPVPDLWLSSIHHEDTGAFNDWLASLMEHDAANCECSFRLVRPDKSEIWALCRAAAVRNNSGRATRLLGSLADITDMKQAEQALAEAVLTDKLTGLANKSRFRERLDEALARTRRSDKHCAVLFFDFDRFKIVNDSLGHNVGDALLVSIADRFRNICRESDFPSRFGGDEFVVLLENIETFDQASTAARRFLDVFADPHDVMGHRVASTASIGLVTSEHGYDSPDDMIRDADAAMYQAKANGRSCVVAFDIEMHERAQRRQEMEEALRDAIIRNQLRLVYQPIIDLNTAQTTGVEVLLRWTHPKWGEVSPADFIPIAEDSGIIVDLGWWVLDEALERCASWQEDGLDITNLAVNVNVSKRQLLADGFVDQVRTHLEHHNLTPKNLKIEVTETTVVDNRAGIAPLLQQLRDHGILIAMDDFGTGHSSLSGLHALPLDIVKIDQSFVRECSQSAALLSIIGAIINLSENLGMTTVAEGLETIDHVAAMQSMNCNYGQGYYFARPLEEKDFIAFVKKSARQISDAA